MATNATTATTTTATTTMRPHVFEINLQAKDKRLDTAADAAPLAQAILAAGGRARSVSLAGNTIGVEAAQVLGAALATLHNLRFLDLHDIFVSRVVDVLRPALAALLKGVQDKPRLRRVDLSDNAFGVRAAHDLSSLLNNPSLLELILNNNGLGTDGAGVIVNMILSGNKLNLRRLLVGRNRLEDGGALHIARAVSSLSSLVELRMPSNSIRSAGLRAVAEALRCCPQLQIIDVSDNCMNREALAAIIDVLPSLHLLRVINFGDTQIGDNGCVRICNIIQQHMHHLEELYLSYNDVEEAGAKAVAAAIEGKKHLRYLDLDGNSIPRSSLLLIKDVLARQGQSHVLAPMEENDFGDDDDGDDDGDEGSRKVTVEENAAGNKHLIMIYHQMHDPIIFGPDEGEDEEEEKEEGKGKGAPKTATAGDVASAAEVQRLRQEVEELRRIVTTLQNDVAQLKQKQK